MVRCLGRLGRAGAAGGGAHALPRRPRRRAAGGARRSPGGGGRRDGGPRTRRTAPPAVHRWATAARVPVRVPAYGEVRRVGALTWQVIGPVRTASAASHGEEGTGAEQREPGAARGGGGRAAAAGRRHGAGGAAGTGPVTAGAAGGRAQGAAPRQPLPGPGRCSRAWTPGSRWSRSAGTTTTATRRRRRCALLRRAGMRVERTDQDGDVAVTVSRRAAGGAQPGWPVSTVRARGSAWPQPIGCSPLMR